MTTTRYFYQSRLSKSTPVDYSNDHHVALEAFLFKRGSDSSRSKLGDKLMRRAGLKGTTSGDLYLVDRDDATNVIVRWPAELSMI